MYPLIPLTLPGAYVQGTLATFIISTIRARGEPTGFTNPQIRIETTDLSSVILADSNMTRAPESYYFYDWQVPSNLTPGTYRATFSSSLNGEIFEKKQYITIIANNGIPAQQILTTNKESELVVGLYYMIKQTQEIPVEYEMAKVSSNGLKAIFSFQKWNTFYDKQTIYRNQEPINTGFTVDYDHGEVIFEDALTEFDTIHADYNFSWFNAEEMFTFLKLSINEVNLVPPGSGVQLANAPELWYPAIIYGAAKNVYRRLIHDLSYQQPKIVYGLDPSGQGGGFEKAIDNFRYLKENYEKDFEQAAKNAKRNQWPTIGAIVAPEFTMPGGRSRWFRYLFKG